MIRFTGVSVQDGLSVGPIHFLHRPGLSGKKWSHRSPEEEQLRFEAARDRAIRELRRLEARVAAHLGSDEAAIFLFQSSMLEDTDYLDMIRSCINACATAEYAVAQTEKAVIEFFSGLDSNYLRARASDIRDLSFRLTDILSDRPAGTTRQSPAILVAEELSPSEAALLDSGLLLGLVSRHGTRDSHIAVLSRAIGVPSVIGIPVDPRWEGRTAILDGSSCTLILDPDAEMLNAAHTLAARCEISVSAELCVPRRPGRRSLPLCATVESAWEAVDAYRAGASSVLYRADALHGGHVVPPSEAEQLLEYRHTLEAMRERGAAFQMIGLGTKDASALHPCPERARLFRTQLRAVLRAAACSDTPVTALLSGSASAADFRWARHQLRRCQRELEREGHPCRAPRFGAVIDSPADVFHADALALESELLAVDGGALLRSAIFDDEDAGHALPCCHTLARMLRRVVRAARRSGCKAVLSGEPEQFPQAPHALSELGFDALSVPVRSLLPLYAALSGGAADAEAKAT